MTADIASARDLGIRVATFDCYGTLVDWEGGVASFLYQLALRAGDPAPPRGQVLRDAWERVQFGLLSGPYRSYEAILVESLEAWAAEAGYPTTRDDGPAFLRAIRSWGPFPDTRPALLRAKAAGLRLVIVSNTDRSIMEHSLRQLDLPFDDAVLAQDAGAYKPDHRVFRTAFDRIGEPPEAIIHVAFGFKYDIGPAKQLGMRTAWVNRHAEPLPGSDVPDHEWRDLWGLARFAGGRGPGIA